MLSDWELSDFIRGKVAEGSQFYRERFEPLLEHEAHNYRVKATANTASRFGADNQEILPPWDDYIGLHPTEVTERMRDEPLDKVRQVQAYEAAGLNRAGIVHFISPAEREPWPEYDQRSVQEIVEKFSILSDPAVDDAIAYERAHKNRPMIAEWDRESFEGDSSVAPAGVTA